MEKPKLIITADDYGLNAACNQGIIEGVVNGVISSVHVMTNMVDDDAMESLQRAVKKARDNGHSVGIGLHLNTTYGPATIQEPASFKHPHENGDKWDAELSYRGINTYVHRSTDLLEMAAELQAQFDQLADYLGGPDKIDAISSHQNIHMWDQPFLIKVTSMAKPHGIKVRSPRRWSTMKELPIPKYYPHGKGKKGTWPLTWTARKYLDALDQPSTVKLLLTPMNADNLQGLHQHILDSEVGVPENNSGHWFGQPSGKAIEWFLEELKNINFSKSGYSSEIFTHLSSSKSKVYDDKRWDYSAKKRYNEYKVVTDPDFLKMFKEKKEEFEVDHGSYRDVLS